MELHEGTFRIPLRIYDERGDIRNIDIASCACDKYYNFNSLVYRDMVEHLSLGAILCRMGFEDI